MEMFSFERALELIKCGTIPKKRGSIGNALQKLRFCFCKMFEESANVFVLMIVNYTRECN